MLQHKINIKETSGPMPIYGELFLSEILSKPIVDQEGDVLGKIKDIIVVKGEPLPIVKKIILSKNNTLYQLDYKNISIFNKRIIAAKIKADKLQPYIASDDDLLSVRDILDKQILDINGAKVVRVNDIRLQAYLGYIVFIAVDIGVRGILRRLGFEKKGHNFLKFFKLNLPYNLIRWDSLQPISPRLKSLSLKMPKLLLEHIHPADIADIISRLSRDEGAHFFKSLDNESAAETLSELEPETQGEIISSLKTERIVDIIEEMSPDDAADILNDLSRKKIREILDNLKREDADSIEKLLAHDSDSAGGLMTDEFLAYKPDLTVEEAMKRFKEDAHDVETIHYIYITDELEILLGIISLRDFLLSLPQCKMSEIMATNMKTLTPEDDEDIVAATFSKYNLVAMPVVDKEGHLLGIISVDDIIDVILPPRAKRKIKKI